MALYVPPQGVAAREGDCVPLPRLKPAQGMGAGSPPPDPLTVDMIEWWSMDAESGVRTGLKSSIALTDVNTVTSQPGMIRNSSSYISANSEKLTTTDSAMSLASHSSWSVSCWAYMDSMTGSTNADSHAVMGRANPSATPANVTEFALHIFPASYSHAPYRNKAVFWHYTASNYKEIISSATLEADTWYHICFGYDATATGAEMWMVIDDGTPQTLSDSVGPSVATSGVFAFGNVENNAIYFTGRTDLDAFWSRTITAAEITRLYASGLGISYPGVAAADSLLHRLQCWYPLDETGGVRANAANSSILSLTDVNTVMSMTGKVDNAASFVQANSETLQFTWDANAYSLMPNVDFTLAVWVYTDSVTTNCTAGGRWLSASNIEWWLYAPLASTSKPKIYWGNGASTVSVETPTAMSNSTWHLVMVEIDRTAGELRISLDNGTPGTVSWTTLNENKGIWGYFGAGNGAAALTGGLDEIAIWHRLLTSDEKARLAVGMTMPV